MICNILENYKDSTLKKLFNTLKSTYFNDTDINKNLDVTLTFGKVTRPTKDIAEFSIDETQIKNLKQNKTAKCTITFNEDVEFNKDILIEAMLHELTHLYQLSQDIDRFTADNQVSHDAIFLKKLKEIQRKSNINIRVELHPDEITPQKDIDRLIKNLYKDFSIITFIQKQQYDIPIATTIIPNQCLSIITNYIKKIYSNYKICLITEQIPNEKYVNEKIIKSSITNVLGDRKSTIYENYTDLTTLIKSKQLNIHYTEIDTLDNNDLIEWISLADYLVI